MGTSRTELQAEIVSALIETKAVDFEAVGSVVAKYGQRAALSGEGLYAVVHWRMIDLCIPPEPYLLKTQREIVITQPVAG